MSTTPAQAPLATASGLVEKVITTFFEMALTVWIASGSLNGFEDVNLWLVAGLAGAGTVIANGLPSALSLPFGLATLYRAARTYAVAFTSMFAAPLFADGTVDFAVALGSDAAAKAAWAALPAALAVLKSFGASFVGQKGSPALLPASMDVPAWQFATAA